MKVKKVLSYHKFNKDFVWIKHKSKNAKCTFTYWTLHICLKPSSERKQRKKRRDSKQLKSYQIIVYTLKIQLLNESNHWIWNNWVIFLMQIFSLMLFFSEFHSTVSLWVFPPLEMILLYFFISCLCFFILFMPVDCKKCISSSSIEVQNWWLVEIHTSNCLHFISDQIQLC